MDTVRSDTLKTARGDSAVLYICREGLKANPQALQFSVTTLGATSELELKLINAGCGALTITRFAVGSPFSVVSPFSQIPANDSIRAIVRFSPRDRKTYQDTIRVEFGNEFSPLAKIPVSGSGRGPKIVLSPGAFLNFGTVNVGDTSTRKVYILNPSATEESLDDTLKITNVTTNHAVYTVNKTKLAIPPGKTDSVLVTFRPDAGQDYLARQIVFSSNDGAQPQAALELNGTGKVLQPPPPITNSNIIVYWPGGRIGYTNVEVLSICVNLDTTGIKEARWKFTQQVNDKPASANDITGKGNITFVQTGRFCFEIPLRGFLTSGLWYWYVWLEGRNGVSGYANATATVLNYDTAPPVFKSLPQVTIGWTGGFAGYTNADSLRLCWENATDLSDIAQVRWKFARTQEVPKDTSDFGVGGDVIRKLGVSCVTIPLKGRIFAGSSRWYFYLWLVDGSGNSSYQNAYETTFIYDLTAPAVPNEPVSRTIPVNVWFGANRTLSLTLDLPAGARDAARVYWKFKRPPQTDSLSDGSTLLKRGTGNNATFSPFFNSTSLCGDDTLYYWLADSAGNVNSKNYSSTPYKYDVCPPVIERSRSGEAVATARTTFVDTIRITDHNPVGWDSVLYRFGGALVHQPPRRLKSLRQDPVDDKIRLTFTLEIPADGVTTRGIEYNIFARDTLRNQDFGPKLTDGDNLCRDDEDQNWYPVRVRITGEGEFRSDKDGKAISQPNGRDNTNYTLFSVPFELDKSTPKDVLEDDLGAYDIKKWRFFEYRTGQTNPWIEYNSANPTITPFAPGQAFFLIVGDSNKVIDSGAGRTVSTVKSYTIELKSGWNLFGNPFNFPIHRDYLKLRNSSIPPDSTKPPSILSYERQWTYDDIVEPWKGYAIYVVPRRPSEKILLTICPIATVPRAGKRSAPLAHGAGEWTIQISARAGAALDTINWVGARASAAEEYDDFDLVEPPVIGDYVAVYVPNANWSQHPMNYTADFRPVGNQAYEWPLQVATNHPNGEVVLDFKEIANLPEGYEAYLIDPQYGMARNLRRDPQYRFHTTGTGAEKSLTLLVGKSEALQKQSTGIALVPQAFELAQNFPNPFRSGAESRSRAVTEIRYALPKSAVVTLEVYNLIGQRVRTLVAQRTQAADYYLVSWDGRDDFGKAVTSGVYIYRLLADSQGEKFTATRKLLVVR
jgi:hypothetical protein